MEIEYPDSGNDGHFTSWTGEATPGVLITVPDIMLGWSYKLQYSCMNKPGPETQGGMNTRSMWRVFFRWEITQRNGSQKRELLGRSGGLTWNYTHPKNSYYMCQARPWGQETDVTQSRPSLWGASNLIGERHIEEKDTHIYILYVLYYIFKLQTWKVPCKRRKDLGFFLPVSMATNPSASSLLPLLSDFFLMLAYPCGLSKGYSSWEKATTRFLLIYAPTRLPCLAVSVGARSDFIIRGAHWGTYRTRQVD